MQTVGNADAVGTRHDELPSVTGLGSCVQTPLGLVPGVQRILRYSDREQARLRFERVAQKPPSPWDMPEGREILNVAGRA